MTDAREAVVDAVREAFAGVRRGLVTLHEAIVIDEYGDEKQRAAARSRDTDSSWERVPDSAIEECAWALPHLDPQSWRYYLAAFMVWSLRHFETSGSIVPDFTIYALEAPKEARLAAWSAERFRGLDAAQARAVCLFLRYMASHNCASSHARRALEQTWGRFCE